MKRLSVSELRRLRDDTAWLVEVIERGLYDRIDRAMPGIRAASLEPSRPAGVSDPTLARVISGPDLAESHERELSNAIDKAFGAIARAVFIAHQYGATGGTYGGVKLNTTDGCQSCARTTLADGMKRWEPPFVESSDVNGTLPRRMRLCRWCYRFVRERKRLPTPEEVDRHHRGERIRMREVGR